MTPSYDQIQDFLNREIDATHADGNWGQVANYIPELGQIDPAQIGIAIHFPDGTEITAGTADKKFSIQSVSKAFMLALALGRLGNRLWDRVLTEPSGSRFDSIVQLELENGIPRNPFINAGAIVTTDAVLEGREPRDTLAEFLAFLRTASGSNDIYINDKVAKSEDDTGHKNYAIANFLRAHGNLRHSAEWTLGTYFHQCAIEMSARELAASGNFLACPETSGLIAPRRARAINALMMTCGHYDGSGDFAYRVGIPGKSGVGGGIIAIVPGRASIGVWSPGLNRWGNSRQGTILLEKLAHFTGWSVFG